MRAVQIEESTTLARLYAGWAKKTLDRLRNADGAAGTAADADPGPRGAGPEPWVDVVALGIHPISL